MGTFTVSLAMHVLGQRAGHAVRVAQYAVVAVFAAQTYSFFVDDQYGIEALPLPPTHSAIGFSRMIKAEGRTIFHAVIFLPCRCVPCSSAQQPFGSFNSFNHSKNVTFRPFSVWKRVGGAPEKGAPETVNYNQQAVPPEN